MHKLHGTLSAHLARALGGAEVRTAGAPLVSPFTLATTALRWWDEQPDTVNTGYVPLEEQSDVDRAVHWLFGHEGLFLNTCGDINTMPRVLDAAGRFTAAPSDEDMQKMVDRLGISRSGRRLQTVL